MSDLPAVQSALAVVCVATMGFAIQRGGTCTVAAVDEVLHQHRARKLGAMFEASLWVAGGLALASLLHLAGSMPGGYAADGWTVLGGCLLGLGAWVNRACVFGTVARLGAGEWAYALTPLGFFLGCLLAGPPHSLPLQAAAPPQQAAVLFGPLFLLFAAWRMARALRHGGLAQLHAKVWAPHAATVVIGVSFVVTLLLVGRWAYTDVLADLAKGMAGMLGLPGVLVLALLAGALWGGRSAGGWSGQGIRLATAARCLIGGAMMGYGSNLIPGSNDGLILVGIPLLRPYAWLAFACMCLTIAAAMRLSRARE